MFLLDPDYLTECPPQRGIASLPQETVLQELLPCESFSQSAVLHECFSVCTSLPWGAVLSEQAAPVRVPHGVTSPVSKHATALAPLSMGSQPLWGIHLVQCGVVHGQQVDLCPPWASKGCRDTAAR